VITNPFPPHLACGGEGALTMSGAWWGRLSRGGDVHWKRGPALLYEDWRDTLENASHVLAGRREAAPRRSPPSSRSGPMFGLLSHASRALDHIGDSPRPGVLRCGVRLHRSRACPSERATRRWNASRSAARDVADFYQQVMEGLKAPRDARRHHRAAPREGPETRSPSRRTGTTTPTMLPTPGGFWGDPLPDRHCDEAAPCTFSGGRTSPVHFFLGLLRPCDHSLSSPAGRRFLRRGPGRSCGTPRTRKQISAGFWPGDERMPFSRVLRPTATPNRVAATAHCCRPEETSWIPEAGLFRAPVRPRCGDAPDPVQAHHGVPRKARTKRARS